MDEKQIIKNAINFDKIEIKQEHDVEECDSIQENTLKNIKIKTEYEELYQDHIVKEEIVFGPETIKHSATRVQTSNNTDDKQIMKYPDIEHIKIKQDICIQVKEECNFQQLNTKLETVKEELNINHFIKNNIALGAEVIQNTSTNRDSVSMDLADYENYPQCHLGQEIHNLDNMKGQETKSKKKCYLCNKALSRRSIQNHIKFYCPMNNNKVQMSCDLCNKVFASQECVVKHMKVSCPMNKNKAERVSCKLCNKVVSTRESLKSHMKCYCPLNKNKTPESCPLCKKLFTSQKTLNYHMKINCPMNENKPNPVSCRLCNKVLSSQRNLTCHMKLFCTMNKNKPKPVTCKLCNSLIFSN